MTGDTVVMKQIHDGGHHLVDGAISTFGNVVRTLYGDVAVDKCPRDSSLVDIVPRVAVTESCQGQLPFARFEAKRSGQSRRIAIVGVESMQPSGCHVGW